MCVTAGNPIRGRLNAWFFDRMDSYINGLLADRKTHLFGQLAGTIVEIGPGVGANFSYLQRGTKLCAVEPNPHMHAALQRRAETYGIDLELLANGAEETDLPSGSVDAVLCSLVLCSVADPEAVLVEVARILKPGGRFVFIEHITSHESARLRLLQVIVKQPWRYLFEGCHTNRATDTLIQSAGFASVDIQYYTMKSPFLPVNSQICGTCIA